MSASTDGLSPRAAVSQMATGYWISQAVRAMAILGLADHLASGPRTATNLAEETGAHAPSLARLLRTLVALGLCGRDDAGRVYLTPIGEAMRSDVSDSHDLSCCLSRRLGSNGAGRSCLRPCARASRPFPASTASASGTT